MAVSALAPGGQGLQSKHHAPARHGVEATERFSPQRHLQMRLVVTIPVLLMLFTIIFGLVSYLSFSNSWDELVKEGASSIASRLLNTHLITMLVLAVVAAL